MTQDVLFTITKDNLETGMRGYPVGYCPTSYVDSEKGLFYVNQPISQIVSWEPMQIIYLLYHGKQGTHDEVAAFDALLKKRAPVPKEVLRAIQTLPRKGHPMKLFCTAFLLLGMYETGNDYREDALNLIAKIPHLAAAVINHHAGWQPPADPQPDLSYMDNFTRMVNVPHAKHDELLRAFTLFNILHYDHGGGNLSAFVGKAVASGLEDMYGSLASAMCALAGPRHGRANQECLAFVQLTLKEVGEKATERDVERFIRHRLDNNQLVFGFGHAVLRVEDPRATVQYNFLLKHYANHPLVKIALLLRAAGSKILTENPKISDPHPNVDAVSGTLLTVSGFPYPEYYTILFGVSRCVGIAIQIVYERLEARGGKGTSIVRPKYLFKAR